MDRLLVFVQGIDDEQHRKTALEDIAPHLAQANDREHLRKCLAIAETIEDELWAPIARGHVIRALLEEDNHQHYPEIVSRSLASIDSLGMDVFEISVLCDIAVALARTGNVEDFSRVLSTLEDLADEKELAAALTRVAQALVESGDHEGVQAAVERTLKIIDQIDYEGDRAHALSRLAHTLSIWGNGEMAAGVARKALALAEELQGGFTRARVLQDIAGVVAKDGNEQDLSRIWAAARGIGDKKEKANALVFLAATLNQAGAPSQPMQVFREALPIARLAGRDSLFDLMKHSVEILESDRRGESLWEVYMVLMEVEHWWDDPLSLFFIS
jgi:hypothetical protein